MKKFQITLVATMLIFYSSHAFAQTLNLYKASKQIQIHSKEKLGKNGKSRLSFFRKKATYYGAMYVNIEEDVGGATWDNHNLSSALRNSKKSCEAKSSKKSGCKLIATAIPRGYKEMKGSVTLNQSASKLYFGKFAREVKKNGWGSIAINSQYSWGWGTSSEAKSVAVSNALGWCKKGSNDAKNEINNFWVTKVVTSKDWKCKTAIVQSK